MILFVDDKAARAALTEGTARKGVSLTLVFTMWTLAAPYDIALWTERVPSKVGPAHLPPTNTECDFEIEPKQDLASVDELFSMSDLSWMLQRAY